MSTLRLRRLAADYEKLRQYVERHPRLQLKAAEGNPPERYQLEYAIRSVRQQEEQLQMVASHTVEIVLPRDYPRSPPQCRMLTPVFHPNIAPHAICVGDHWSAGEPIWSIVARIGEMLAYQTYNTKSPLNGEAARWVDENIAKFPLDDVSMIVDEPAPAVASPAAPTKVPQNPGVATPGLPSDSAEPAQLATRNGSSSTPVSAPPAPSAQPPVLPAAAPRSAPAATAPAPPPAASPSAPQTGISVSCPGCGARYVVSATLAGRKARCRQCQTVLTITAPEPPAPGNSA